MERYRLKMLTINQEESVPRGCFVQKLFKTFNTPALPHLNNYVQFYIYIFYKDLLQCTVVILYSMFACDVVFRDPQFENHFQCPTMHQEFPLLHSGGVF